MAFLYNKLNRKILLSLILLWTLASFWQLNQILAVKSSILAIGLLALVFTWFEVAPLFLLVFLSFTASYAFYGFLFQYGLPIWLIMLALAVIFGYIYLYVEQKIGILGNQRLIYLILFCLITLEVFLALSYFLINPLSKSLVIAIASYLFMGFSYAILAKHSNKLATYVIISMAVILAVLLSSNWGGAV